MNDQIKARLHWVNLFLDTKNAGLVCRRCGIGLRKRRLGSRRIQSGLKRLHACSLARGKIQNILHQHQQPPLKKTRRPRKTFKRYAREIPGQRVQLDTCEIADGLYQDTAIDDCSKSNERVGRTQLSK